MRSSTSNSKRGRKPPRALVYAGWGLLFFLVFLVLAEVFVFRDVRTYGYSPGFLGQIAELDASFAHADQERIQIAIFGDSEGMDALRPDLIAQAAGVDVRSIFNFSLSGGSAYDIAQAYKRYGEKLPHLRIAIVEVNEFQLNNSDAASDIKFKYFAGLRDRLSVMNKDNYGELLLGWALKSYDLRTVWKMLLNKYFKGGFDPSKGGLRREIPVHAGGLPPVVWSPPEDKIPEKAGETADRWFQDYKLTGVRTKAFERMIADLHERGVEVHLVQLPRTAYFEQAISEEYAFEQQAFREKVAAIAEKYGVSYDILPGRGLTLDDYRDSNHVKPSGAEQLSAAIAKRWIKEK